MNWNRGLFRLWIVLSVVWLALAGTGAAIIWTNDTPARSFAAAVLRYDTDCHRADGSKPGPWCDVPPVRGAAPMPDGLYAGMLAGPPLLLLILGWLCLWTARGFRESRASHDTM
jgi:hypothetical protein